MAEWSKAAASKAVIPLTRNHGFESHSLLHLKTRFFGVSLMNKDMVNLSQRTIPGIKYDQLVYVAPKDWGHEEWIVNNAKYCGKKLVFNTGGRCSLHYHKIKEETFYILSGKIYIELVDGNKKINRVMEPGDTQHILPGLWHRITALQPSEVMEFSTFHMEDDSYRIELAGVINVHDLCL